MEDPLSIAASVAGLITLAASTTKLAKTLLDRYNEKAAASVRGNVETLDSALIRINRSLEHQAFDHPGEEILRQPIECCARTLRNIEMQFQKLEIKGYSWHSMRGRIARPEVLREISTLQITLEGQKTTLLIAMQNCTGESQSKMLHMIFNAIEELRAIIEREKPMDTSPQEIDNGVLANLMRADFGYASTPSVVHVHPSFDDWLSTWATPDDQDGQPTSLTDQSPKEGHLNSESGTASSRPLQNVKLIIEGLPQAAQEGNATSEITTPANTPLYDIMFQLDKEYLQPPKRDSSDNLQGPDRICGFAIVDNGTKVAPFMPWSTSFVVVMEGPSCYDVQSGLKINHNESLVHFYNGCAQGISEFLGPFPLFDTEAYRDRLPKEMKQKGGLFFPIFQREAPAVSFENTSKGDRRAWEDEDDQQFAIKVYSGSINCVSGQQVIDSVPHEQDYIICSRQRRLDGFKSADNETRQFVAMPLGWEYSAEHQLTDKEDVGGIQLQIAPRLRDCVEFRALDHLWNLGWSFPCSATASELGLVAGSVVAMSDFDSYIKLLNEFEHSFADRSRWQIHGWSNPLLYPMDETGLHRVTWVQDLLQRRGGQNLGPISTIRLQPVLSVAIELKFTIGDERHQSGELNSAGWEISLGAGARLLQETHRGKEQTWDCNNSCLVNIQLLNAAAFKSVTGIPAWTPISLLDYRKKGRMLQVPVVAESTYDSTTQVATICDLKSISALDITLSDDVRYKRRIISCPQCETDMRNVALSVNNVDSSRAQNHGCSPRASTCLEALVDLMETDSIGPDGLLRCGVDLKLWLCPQKTPSLKCVARFLKQGGRSFLKDYGFNLGDLQMPVSRKVREMLLEDFISNDFYLNARDTQGRTILWTERQLTYMLLDNGARVDIPDNDGNTLLHALVAKQDPTSLQKNQRPLETLLNHKKGREAVNVRNRDGLTPYQLALGIDAIHYWDIYTRLFDNAEADIRIVFPKGVYRDKLTYSLAKWQAEVGSVSAFRRPAAEERLLRARLAMSYS
ncbi:hypothetical protein CGMCC3_g3415 [Colletotrichum fructicola]|nr:uncharacterized protein CGMCC3_g3415 [Colletotrichum fructicola]KAE9580695.1 hypothetical protein CGMCC3_g3415 [Colletotrichum fructicola]